MTERIACAVLVLVTSVSAAAAQTTDPKAAPPPTTVDASSGGVTFSSGVNSLTIGARTQFLWTLDDREQFDADREGSGVGVADDAISAFDVPRVRVSLGGTALRPWMRYSLQFEFGRTSSEGANKIKDAILEIRPPGRNFRILTGQFKTPFGLQLLTSSGRLQFVDRAITDSKFNPGRDMGVMFGGTLAARRVGYDVGVFNGAGEANRQNNNAHLWVGRIYVDPLGPYALSEGATEAAARPVLHLGAAVRGGDTIRGRTTPGVDAAESEIGYNVEFALQYRRLYSTAEYFWSSRERDSTPAAADLDARGYHAQFGVMLVPRTTEVAIRYAAIDGDVDRSAAAVTELRGVVSHYWQGHNLKLQGDVGRTRFGAGFAGLSSAARQGLPTLGTRLIEGQRLSDHAVRVQLQLTF